MAYNEFAYFYDELNGEADYNALYAYVKGQLDAHGVADGIVADKTTPRLIQFHTLKNAVNPPFLGGFFISNTVVWHRQNGNLTRAIHAFWQYSVTIEKLSLRSIGLHPKIGTRIAAFQQQNYKYILDNKQRK